MYNNSCIVPILNYDSTKLIKNACLIFERVTLLFRTSTPQAKRERFPLSGVFFSADDERNKTQLELEWLYSNGILNCPASDPFYSGFEMGDFESDKPVWIYRTEKGGFSSWQITDETFDVIPKHYVMPAKIDMPIYNDKSVITSIAHNTLPLKNNKTHVVEIVLKHLPVLSEDTPWEDVLEWRNDKDAQIKLRRLKHWINSISERDEINLHHLEDEILYLLDEYEQYMKIKKRKFSHSSLYTIVTTIGEILENTVKLKFQKLSELPFKIQESNILLAEEELSAPGRELAYIVSTREHFNI